MSVRPYGYVNAFKHNRDHFVRTGVVHKSVSVAQTYLLSDLAVEYSSIDEAKFDWTWVGVCALYLVDQRSGR